MKITIGISRTRNEMKKLKKMEKKRRDKEERKRERQKEKVFNPLATGV